RAHAAAGLQQDHRCEKLLSAARAFAERAFFAAAAGRRGGARAPALVGQYVSPDRGRRHARNRADGACRHVSRAARGVSAGLSRGAQHHAPSGGLFLRALGVESHPHHSRPGARVLFVAAVGLGAFAGTLALAIHTATVLGKLLSESVENIDEGVVEAIRATGAGYGQILSFAVLPQILP